MIATMAMPQLSSDKRNPHLRRIAIFQIISGGLSLVLGIIGVIWYSMFDFQVGSGIWAGLFVIVTGIVGYRTIKKNIPVSGAVTYTAYLVMNILSSVLIGVAIFFTSVTAAYSMDWIDRYCDHQWDPDWTRRCNMHQSIARAAWGASLILAINLSAVFVASIVASAFCCVCCGRTMNPRVGIAVGPVSNQQPAAQIAAPIQYSQQPQITSQQEQQLPVTQQQQPIMIQQPMMQPQPMIFQQPMMQQPFWLQQMPLSAPQQQPPQQHPPQQQPPQQQPQQQLQQDQQHGNRLQQPKPHQEYHQEVPDLPEYSP